MRGPGGDSHRAAVEGLGASRADWPDALLAHLQRLTAAVERVEGQVGAVHDRLDTLERAWKARGSL